MAFGIYLIPYMPLLVNSRSQIFEEFSQKDRVAVITGGLYIQLAAISFSAQSDHIRLSSIRHTVKITLLTPGSLMI